MEASDTTPSEKDFQKLLIVKNKLGVHARPAAMIVRVANRYKSEVYFEKDGELVNGKSIMGLMMLAAGEGSKIKLTATGDDSKEACEAMEELFERKFDES